MAVIQSGADVAVNHAFVSGKANGADPTFVQPSNWNDKEVLGQGADGQKVVRDSGNTHGASWLDCETGSFTNNTGAGAAVGDVVAVSLAADKTVVLDDTQSSLRRFVVALQAPANAAPGAYGTFGGITGVKAQGAIAAGQYVRKSATAKAVEDAGVTVGSAANPPSGALGFATTAAAAGVVNVFWFAQTAIAPNAAMPTSYLRGLGMVRNGATATKLDIATGSARDVGDTADMVLASLITKDLNAAWAVGSGNGGIDTGTIAANTWYHVFLIKRPDTGVVDALFSTSASAPTMPANYTLKRRIGSVRTDATPNIILFRQQGDQFLWDTVPALDFNGATGTAANTITHTAPTGVIVWVFGSFNATAGSITFYHSSLDTVDLAPSTTVSPLGHLIAVASGPAYFPPIKTNTSAQTRLRCNVNTTGEVSTYGWIDRRGRDD